MIILGSNLIDIDRLAVSNYIFVKIQEKANMVKTWLIVRKCLNN